MLITAEQLSKTRDPQRWDTTATMWLSVMGSGLCSWWLEESVMFRCHLTSHFGFCHSNVTVSPLFMCCYNMFHLFMYAFTQNAPSGVVVVMPVRVWGSLGNTLSNITALNENVLSTALWKCLGIDTLQQQMLGQAVLSRLPFRGLSASVCQMMGVIPAPVPPSGPYTLILSSVLFTIWWRITSLYDESEELEPGVEGWMSV